MSFELRFKDEALREWRRLDGSIRESFKKKLAERLIVPRVPASKLLGHPDRYKIKLRGAGYRLVYEVRDAEVVVVVIAVGKRERGEVYHLAAIR
jgi:mRNA interferase RelE/StbE